jgi:hypothetical protein
VTAGRPPLSNAFIAPTPIYISAAIICEFEVAL